MPQGLVLGPIPFMISINDIDNHIICKLSGKVTNKYAREFSSDLDNLYYRSKQ